MRFNSSMKAVCTADIKFSQENPIRCYTCRVTGCNIMSLILRIFFEISTTFQLTTGSPEQ